MTILRSVLAVLAGILTLTITSFAIEAVLNPVLLRLFHNSPPNQDALNQNIWTKLLMIAYTMLCVAGGGYVTAWLARESKVLHAVIMGVVETAMTVWVLTSLPTHAPVWSSILGAVLVIPAAWCGGILRMKAGTAAHAISVQ